MSVSTIPVLFDWEKYEKELQEKDGKVQSVEVEKYEKRLGPEYRELRKTLGFDDMSLRSTVSYPSLDTTLQYDSLAVKVGSILYEKTNDERFKLLLRLSIKDTTINYSPDYVSPNWAGRLNADEVVQLAQAMEETDPVLFKDIDSFDSIAYWIKKASEQRLGITYSLM